LLDEERKQELDFGHLLEFAEDPYLTNEELVQVELMILDAVEYDVSPPTAETFMQIEFVLMEGDEIDLDVFVLSRLLCEFGLFRGGRFTLQRHQQIAQGAILAAKRLLHRDEDGADHPLVRDMARLFVKEVPKIPHALLQRHGITRC
jgi:hypothetical protein